VIWKRYGSPKGKKEFLHDKDRRKWEMINTRVLINAIRENKVWLKGRTTSRKERKRTLVFFLGLLKKKEENNKDGIHQEKKGV